MEGRVQMFWVGPRVIDKQFAVERNLFLVFRVPERRLQALGNLTEWGTRLRGPLMPGSVLGMQDSGTAVLALDSP